jgi:hypothetical protein
VIIVKERTYTSVPDAMHTLQRLLQNEIANRQVEGNLHGRADFEPQVEDKAQKVAAC